jgi:sugar phosphate isomerase/epimerase
VSSGAQRFGSRRVLCAVSFSTTSFRDLVDGAVAGHFHAVSVLARAHRRARLKEGLSDTAMRRLLDDHGLAVTEMEAVGDWLAASGPSARPWLDPVYSEPECLDVAAALGASTLVATHFGDLRSLDEAGEAFASLCDRALGYGLDVSLEFVPFSGVKDVATAWQIVERAGRANAGILVDCWHHYRGGGDGDALQEVPGDRILAVQLSDALAEPQGDLVDDVTRRLLPGEGDLGVIEMIRTLDKSGVDAPVGIEVYDAALLALGPVVAGQRLGRALRDVIAEALG